jgi:hypothetical protein
VKLAGYLAAIACFASWFLLDGEAPAAGVVFFASTVVGIGGVLYTVATSRLRVTVSLWLALVGLVWIIHATMAQYPDIPEGACDPACFPSYGVLDAPMLLAVIAVPLTGLAIALRAIGIGFRAAAPQTAGKACKSRPFR